MRKFRVKKIFNNAVNVSSISSKKINISAKYTNPAGCTNLSLSAVTDTPTFTVGTATQYMFESCISLTTINKLKYFKLSL